MSRSECLLAFFEKHLVWRMSNIPAVSEVNWEANHDVRQSQEQGQSTAATEPFPNLKTKVPRSALEKPSPNVLRSNWSASCAAVELLWNGPVILGRLVPSFLCPVLWEMVAIVSVNVLSCTWPLLQVPVGGSSYCNK